MGIFQKPVLKLRSKIKSNVPEGLWTKCPSCGEVITQTELQQNLQVCPRCQHHMTLGARDRIESLADEGSFQEHDAEMLSVDSLKFRGVATYQDRLETYRKKTGLKDAVITGDAMIGGCSVGIAVMDFNFIAATMGSVVGEKITRTIERATKNRWPVIIVSASGGARMYEGMLSLMQMAKTSGALARHAAAKLPYISVLTNPTTAGVMASYASLGDIIMAEPKCMIGFAGPRVIRETTHQELPKGFQTAEFLQDHGLVDMIVARHRLRDTLSQLLHFFGREK
ncbi:MAG: acetyl-CoA carboxylase, carboxyltransferase subunit beta [Verrucomicrobia bacterium]|jgi:acetyl-CoA carboxylase carboxyl transferase subunit beta|nr:acetyl-CoA carboxylase, carboxyltransferase subunit beta [Verrucomicrobiota bacterium]MDA1204302.1 acetyl-CoA carboxylase, carboxyltransferase subunit beta [Verrucomicrobiota bacterium]